MKDTSDKKLLRLALAVKGFTAAIGVSALVADYKWVAIAILIVGAIANEVINYVGNDRDEKDTNSNSSNIK